MKRWTGFIRAGAFLALVAVVACSNFKSSRRMDMGPFAENTVNMLAEAQKVVQPLQWNYLRDYRPMANRDSIGAELAIVRGVFRGIGLYSIQVVSLNNANLSGKERAAKLADYLDDVCRPIVQAGKAGPVGLTAGHLDSVLTNIRAQTDYLSAIGAANPLIYSIVTYTIARVDHLQATLQPVFGQIASDIESRYADTRHQVTDLNALETRDVRTFIALEDYRGGTGSLESVVASDPSIAVTLAPGGKSSAGTVDAAQGVLRQRLATIDEVRKQLELKTDLHNNQAAELDDFQNELDRRVRAARLMLIYWLRSHSNLAAGIQVPPAINIGEMVGSSAKKAVSALP